MGSSKVTVDTYAQPQPAYTKKPVTPRKRQIALTKIEAFTSFENDQKTVYCLRVLRDVWQRLKKSKVNKA